MPHACLTADSQDCTHLGIELPLPRPIARLNPQPDPTETKTIGHFWVSHATLLGVEYSTPEMGNQRISWNTRRRQQQPSTVEMLAQDRSTRTGLHSPGGPTTAPRYLAESRRPPPPRSVKAAHSGIRLGQARPASPAAQSLQHVPSVPSLREPMHRVQIQPAHVQVQDYADIVQEQYERAVQERAFHERAMQERIVQERMFQERAAQESALQKKAMQERALQEKMMREREMQERGLQERAMREREMQERALRERAMKEKERTRQDRTLRQRIQDLQHRKQQNAVGTQAQAHANAVERRVHGDGMPIRTMYEVSSRPHSSSSLGPPHPSSPTPTKQHRHRENYG